MENIYLYVFPSCAIVLLRRIAMAKVINAGASCVIAAICDAIGLVEVIDSIVPWDPSQCKLSPGLRIKALIINILMRRSPLYLVEVFYEHLDVGALFGNLVSYHDLNDSALGRALDKLYEAGPEKVFSAVAMNAIFREGVEVDILHGDTTSWSVTGVYETEEEMGLVEEEAEEEGYEESRPLRITYGYNKNHRPDLKQFKYGLIVTKDRIPMVGQVRDGDLDDKTWNNRVMERLASCLSPEALKKIIYVTDCALITKDNLEAAKENELKFISRLPGTFSLEQELKGMAWSRGEWVELGELAKNKRPDSARYKYQEFSRELYGIEYRFIVVHSSKLDRRKSKKLDRELTAKRKELQKKAAELEAIEFACEPDAIVALSRFKKELENPFFDISGEVVAEEVPVKRLRKGRPRKDEVAPTRRVYRVKVLIGELDQEAYREEMERRSCFVLITNIEDKEAYPASSVVSEYKNQTAIELQFKAIKDPEFVGAMYVKKPERLEALAYVVLMAALVRSIIERRVRRSLAEKGEPLPLPGKKYSFEPTGEKVLECLDWISVIVFEDGRRELSEYRSFPYKVFEALNLNPSIYIRSP